MKATALSVLDDLRARKLWPVALVMVIALVAVPVLLLEPAEEVPAPAATATPSAPEVGGGIPGPEEALEGKPLVSLAVLDSPSDLESFSVKNPFKPIDGLDDGPILDDDSPIDVIGGPPTDGEPTVDGGGPGDPGTGDPGTGSPGDGGPGTPGGPDTTQPPTTDPSPPTTDPDPQPQLLTYALDLTFDGPTGAARSYRNLARLAMLPNESSPLLIFLGVGASGNNAVFLVDSTLEAVAGDGRCSPSPEECATLSIEPGEVQTFIDEQDRKYTIQIDQIREQSVARAAELSAAREASQASASVGRRNPVRRFIMPVLTDLFVTGGQE